MLLYGDHQSIVFALAFSPDGSSLASGAKDGAVSLRDIEGNLISLCEAGPKTPAVNALAVLPDHSVAIGHARGWHLLSRTEDSIRVSRFSGISTATITPPDPKPLAVGMAAGGKHLHGHTDDSIRETSWPEISTTAIASLGPKLLAVGTGLRGFRTSGTLELWDLATGQRREPFFQEPNGVRAIATAPERGLVAWATGHFMVKLWDVRKQTPVVFPQKKDVYAVALSSDGVTMAAAVDHHTLLYDIERRRERGILKGHKSRVEAVAFSPNGSIVATGSWDQTVRLWDVESGREIACYQWPIGKVFSLAYAPDGLRLAAGGDLGMVVVWDVE